jgi:hypothetical protein
MNYLADHPSFGILLAAAAAAAVDRHFGHHL